MMMRLHVATALAVMVAWPMASALASDPLKLPGTEPKPMVEAKPVAAAGKAPVAAGAPPAATMTDTQKYCQNIAAAAADARFAWQSKKLSDVETQIKQRLADLEARQAEVTDILARYNDALKHANQNIVDIYAKMKPETAAGQIAGLDDSAAAAILSKLSVGKASAILNEIPADRAVRLVSTMSALVPPTDGKKS